MICGYWFGQGLIEILEKSSDFVQETQLTRASTRRI